VALNVRQLHPLFVGAVSGIDLRTVHDRVTLDEIRAALDRFSVLVFRDQPFEDEEQIAWARRLDGVLQEKNGRKSVDREGRLKFRQLSDVSNLDDNNQIFPRNDPRRIFVWMNRLWHTDASFQDPAARYSMLSAKIVPPAGGETEYADMRAAYDELPDDLKAQIEDLRARHSSLYTMEERLGHDGFTPEQRAELRGAEHPVVRVHPGSQRKTLYLASHASEIIGWPVPEGRALLDELVERATQPEFVYRHNWRVNDFVIWDNRCTMHRLRPFDSINSRRELRRVTTLDVVPSQAPITSAT
jgi:alpha-ketoglutarate-dependent 2,4-dichlorophenoxyacetate dioxygenase